MSEEALRDILEKAVLIEYADNDDLLEHKFSLKHRSAMKRIFAKYEKSTQRTREKQRIACDKKRHISVRKRVFITAVIVLLMAFLTGCVTVYFSEKFSGIVYPGNTHLYAAETEGCPTVIEYKYAPVSVPEGFEVMETVRSPIDALICYRNSETGQIITLSQWVKSEFNTHYNTENHELEEITVNGKSGLCIDFSGKTHIKTLIVWDNEDYIIEIVADFNKERTLNLCELHKIEI